METAGLLSHLDFIKSQISKLQSDAREIENELLSRVEKKYEGTSNGEGFKVVFKVTRSVDVAALEEAADKIPAELWPCKTKQALDLKTWRKLYEHDPELACSFVTEKPAKASISVVEEEDGN